MKLQSVTLDDIYNAALRGHVHLWCKTEDTIIKTAVPLWSGMPAPWGELEAVRHSKADDCYWCRYCFDGTFIQSVQESPPSWDGDGWHTSAPLKAGERMKGL